MWSEENDACELPLENILVPAILGRSLSISGAALIGAVIFIGIKIKATTSLSLASKAGVKGNRSSLTVEPFDQNSLSIIVR